MEGAPQTLTHEASAGEPLAVTRYFTSPGVHPFDSVAWELRDARIGFGGNVSFEQTDVEFPSTWSQNATNIVAQKYFRGRLDSPSRERSVKQMIGRVSGTIADWGRQRGYFASAEDGDAFEAELAYILLHQMAAFNSPVWFNVGFEESPQCSACMPFHQKVSTPEGMVAIGELVEREEVGREVYDADGVTRIVAVQHNGTKPVFRVTLHNGQSIEATADHVVKAVAERRTAPSWLRVDELQVGMRMHLHPHRAKAAAPVLVPAGTVGADEPTIEAVDPVAEAEAALAGWLQADGFVGQYKHGTNRSLTLEFQVSGRDEREWIEENLDVVFPDVHRKIRTADTLEVAVERIRLYGEVLRPFVERWGLLARGTDIRVPEHLFTASCDEIVAYLRSIFQADGYVSVRRERGCESARVGFAVIGRHWIEDVQLLLNVIGIYSRMIHKPERRADRHDMHELAISIGSERARFGELVGFVDRRKSDKLLASLDLRNPKRCPDLREEEIVSITPVGEHPVYDIQTESGEFLANNIAVHNCFILSVEDTMDSILDWNTREGRIFRGGSGSGINLSKIRGSMETLSKGGTASGPVSFMRGADAWAGTIKSGGKTRRAAKMVVLDVDHPDIREFIWCKAKEEDKARALAKAGFDMSLDGDGMISIQYQNANNSVRVTDEFMRAVENGEEWRTTSRATGEPIGEPIAARELMREIADAAWRCADPGVQYDTTINRWHTSPNSGRINASNPCFPADARVHTTLGLMAFGELYERWQAGEEDIEVYTHRATAGENGSVAQPKGEGVAPSRPLRVMQTGVKPIVRLQFANGSQLRCTPNHRLWTLNRGYVAAEELTAADRVLAVVAAAQRVPVGAGGASSEAWGYAGDEPTSLVACEDDGQEVVYNLTEPLHHSYLVDGVVVANCSEYMHVDDSACNLSSLNLMKFRRADGTFDVRTFEHAVDIMFLAQEIVVGPSSYPTEEIGVNARAFRQLGLGYANLGAYLMADGLAYDSEAGRGVAAAITSLMTGRGYLQSARVAAAIGPYERYAENRDAHNGVMRMHRDASYAIPDASCSDTALLEASRTVWDEAVTAGELHGYRNAQATVLAPTGTISFLMDCDTTGVEPDFSLVKYKTLVGGGTMTIANRTVPLALETLGYAPEQIEQIEAHVAEHNTMTGAPGLEPEHMPVFDVAVGENAISYMGHITMMGAVQPFLSGAISKCIVGDSLLVTERGLVRIDSLHRGEAADTFRALKIGLASLGGVRATDAFYYGGDRPVRRAVLRSGHKVTGTPNHRVLVAAGASLEWRRLDELEPGDRVATKYGDELWATEPPSLTDFAPAPAYGCQKQVVVPHVMTAELAFFLGAFAAEGHIARTNWTVRIANADEDVLARVVAAAESVFGCTPRISRDAGKCPSVDLSSKTVVEFLEYLQTGSHAASKRIPDAVLTAPRPMVLAFLEGLTLDSYLPASLPKWAICLASNDLLDDLQAVLTNLGVVNSRIRKYDATYDKWFEEVYVTGRHAQRLVADLRFPERHKQLRAVEIATGTFLGGTADVVPGITGAELYELIPRARGGHSGRGSGHSREFSYLKDTRTQEVSRASLARVATVEGVELPDWLDRVLEDNLHFSPVESIEDAGTAKVFDVSVPGPHAFVANGIVNHNTVNMPAESTVEDIADAYLQAWHLGVKALAIYRDGSKNTQVLGNIEAADAIIDVAELAAHAGLMTPEEVEARVAMAVSEATVKAATTAVAVPVAPAVTVGRTAERRRMPRERQSITHKFSIGGHEGYITCGMYEDGTVGEIFLTDIGKEGSTMRGMMNSFATAISIALQYGVPLETLVQKFAYMRFEPEGITQNPEIPFAKSMPDYIMRWLASRFLDADSQEELGILTPEVRRRKEAQDAGLSYASDTAGLAAPSATGPAAVTSAAPSPPTAALTDTPPVVPIATKKSPFGALELGPACGQCGGMMQRTGSCYTCPSCGNNTGCG
jgi:ribonucleotide reductase alpha subunit